MKGIADILWNNPTAFAGAVQVANVTAVAEGVVPWWAAVLVAVITTAANYAVVKPARPRR